MKKIFKSPLFNIALVLLFTFIALYASLAGDFEEVINAFSKINYFYIFLCLFMTFLWQYFIGLTFKVLYKSKGIKYSSFKGFLNALVGALFNNITPSATGGQFAQYYIFKKQKVEEKNIAPALWGEFIVYQSTLCIMSLFFIFIKFKYFYDSYSELFVFVLFGFALSSFVIVFLVLFAKFKGFQRFISGPMISFLAKIKLVKKPDVLKESIQNKFNEFNVEATDLLKNKKALFQCFLLCVIRNTIYYSIPFVAFVALGNPANFDIFINCVALCSFVQICASLIPIPGSSGVSEATFLLMFTSIYDKVQATSSMIIWRFFTFYLLTIVGAIVYCIYKFKKDKK